MAPITYEEHEAIIRGHRNIIEDRTDGPLTRFVLISRACNLISLGNDPDSCANALYYSLIELGLMNEDDI